MRYHLMAQLLPILSISEILLRPGVFLPHYVHYCNVTARNNLGRALLFIYSSIKQAPQDVSRLYTPRFELTSCTTIFHTLSVTIAPVYVRPSGRFDKKCISSHRQFSGSLKLYADIIMAITMPEAAGIHHRVVPPWRLPILYDV